MDKIKVVITILILTFFIKSVKGYPETDSIAHPFILSDLRGNKISSEKIFSSKLTVLIFWSSWEIDSLNLLVKWQKYFDKFNDKGLSVVGICSEKQKITEQQKNNIIELIQNKKISFPILLDEGLSVFNLYRVIALPTTFLIDQSKRITLTLFGLPLVETEQMFKTISDTFEPEKKKLEVVRSDSISSEASRYFNYANTEFKRGKIENAKKYAEKAKLVDSSFTEPLLLLTQISLEERNYDELKKYLLKLESASVNSYQFNLLKCEYLITQKKYDEAIKKLDSFNPKGSNDSYLHALLGYALGMKKNIQMCEQEFSIAAKLDSLDYRVARLKAEVYNFYEKSKEADELLNLSKRLRRQTR